jgi:hypothetical protein
MMRFEAGELRVRRLRQGCPGQQRGERAIGGAIVLLTLFVALAVIMLMGFRRRLRSDAGHDPESTFWRRHPTCRHHEAHCKGKQQSREADKG